MNLGVLDPRDAIEPPSWRTATTTRRSRASRASSGRSPGGATTSGTSTGGSATTTARPRTPSTPTSGSPAGEGARRVGDRRGLSAHRDRGPARARLAAPHPAAHGARQLRPAAWLRPGAPDRVVHRRLRGRDRLGDAREHHRDVAARGRRDGRHEAVRLRRALHRPDVRTTAAAAGTTRRSGSARTPALHGRLLGPSRGRNPRCGTTTAWRVPCSRCASWRTSTR